MPEPPLLYIGIDAGGTKTTLYAATADGQVHFEGRSGPANLRVQGVLQAYATITGLAEDAQDILDLPIGGLCVGAAGAGDPIRRTELSQRLQQWSSVPITVTTDADIALRAALGTAAGYLVIAGTGSIVYARSADGIIHRAGGWGYKLGDDGSGTALGQAALRAVAAAFDGGMATLLTALLARRHSVQDLTGVIDLAFASSSLAVYAPLVFKAAAKGDAVAVAIVDTAATQLAGHVLRLAKAQPTLPKCVMLTGGLTRERLFCAALQNALDHVSPGWQLAPSSTEPQVGAWAAAVSGGAPTLA